MCLMAGLVEVLDAELCTCRHVARAQDAAAHGWSGMVEQLTSAIPVDLGRADDRTVRPETHVHGLRA